MEVKKIEKQKKERRDVIKTERKKERFTNLLQQSRKELEVEKERKKERKNERTK